MKTICLYFEIHQIIHLKRYRCFDIGTDHYYYDDYENERSITEIAERSYIPALTTCFLKMFSSCLNVTEPLSLLLKSGLCLIIRPDQPHAGGIAAPGGHRPRPDL